MPPLTGLGFLLGLVFYKDAAPTALRLALENLVTVVAKKISIWFSQFFWQPNRLPFKRNKVLLQRWLRKKTPQSLAQNHIQFVVERDESSVKRGIVKRREAKAVSGIESVGGKFPPRLDVTRNQQARHVDSADAATHVISGEN